MNTMPTKTQLRKMPKAELVEFAQAHCLLEHLDRAEVDAMTKAAVLAEVDGALLRIEVANDHEAMATDTVAKSVAEVIGLDAKPAKRARKAKDSDLVWVDGVGTTLPAQRTARKAAPKATPADTDKAAKAIAKRIAQLRAKDLSWRKVAETMNAEGTLSLRGRPWSANASNLFAFARSHGVA